MNSAFAALRLRLLAFLLDYIWIAGYIGVLIVASISLGFSPLRAAFLKLFADPNSSEITAFLLLVLPVVLYFALFECSHWQATWGKQKMGLLVTTNYRKRPGLARSLFRSLLKFLPWELTHACLWRIPGWPLAPKAAPSIIVAGLILVWVIVGMYVMSLLISKTHQTLYDLLAGTRVVKIQSGRII
ncbi:MAG TPA: RDD family protein [Ktedonobacteraceae bacterium]|nr:RDD family protein [Ktedonobacteraceae bacterium]